MRAHHALALFALALLVVFPPSTGAPALDEAGPAVVTLEVGQVGTLTPGEARSASVTVRLCSPSGAPIGGPERVTVGARGAPAWLDVRFEPDAFTFPLLLPGDCDEARGTARFNASRSAPAFQMASLTLVARDHASREARAVDYFVRVGYYGALKLWPGTAKLPAPLGSPVPLALTVENHGNAPTRFEVRTAGPRDDVSVVLPQPLVLTPGERGEWTVRFVLPVEAGLDARAIDLLVTSHARFDHTSPGASATVSVTLDPRLAPFSDRVRFIAPTVGDLAPFAFVAAVAILIGMWQARKS